MQEFSLCVKHTFRWFCQNKTADFCDLRHSVEECYPVRPLSWHTLQCVRHHVTLQRVCPCLPSLLGHDECSTISTVQAAGQRGKQTQQATVVDLFIRPQSSSQPSAPCAGPDSHTSKCCLLKKTHRWKCVNSRFSFFFVSIHSKDMQLALWRLWACGLDGEGVWRPTHHDLYEKINTAYMHTLRQCSPPDLSFNTKSLTRLSAAVSRWGSPVFLFVVVFFFLLASWWTISPYPQFFKWSLLQNEMNSWTSSVKSLVALSQIKVQWGSGERLCTSWLPETVKWVWC